MEVQEVLEPNRADYLEKLLLKVPKKHLHPFITCYLCGGFFRDACTVNECLDTFCRPCIVKYFASHNREQCPKCKKHVGGRPLESLVTNVDMQKVVDTLYPEFQALDAKAEEALYETFPDLKKRYEIEKQLERQGQEEQPRLPDLQLSLKEYGTDRKPLKLELN